MHTLQAGGLEVPAHSIARDGGKCLVRFDCPGARKVVVSAEALEGLGVDGLYQLCRDEMERSLAACGLAPARDGDPGAFYVRWKED